MKRVENDFIIHGLFVYDMMHIPTNDSLRKEFMDKYSKDFDITGGTLMESFLGIEVEQSDGEIRLHLDKYIKDIIDEYSLFSSKPVRPRSVPSQPGPLLTRDDCPVVPDGPDPVRQKLYRSMIAKLQFAATCGFASIFRIQLLNSHVFVYQPAHLIGMCYADSSATLRDAQASNLRIDHDLPVAMALWDLLMQIGLTV